MRHMSHSEQHRHKSFCVLYLEFQVSLAGCVGDTHSLVTTHDTKLPWLLISGLDPRLTVLREKGFKKWLSLLSLMLNLSTFKTPFMGGIFFWLSPAASIPSLNPSLTLPNSQHKSLGLQYGSPKIMDKMEFWAFLFFGFKINLTHFAPKLTKKKSAIVRFQFCGNNTEKTINFWLILMVYIHVRVRHNVLSCIILWGLSKFVFKNNGDWCWGRG